MQLPKLLLLSFLSDPTLDGAGPLPRAGALPSILDSVVTFYALLPPIWILWLSHKKSGATLEADTEWECNHRKNKNDRDLHTNVHVLFWRGMMALLCVDHTLLWMFALLILEYFLSLWTAGVKQLDWDWWGGVWRRQFSMPICYGKVTDMRDFIHFNELTKLSRTKSSSSWISIEII